MRSGSALEEQHGLDAVTLAEPRSFLCIALADDGRVEESTSMGRAALEGLEMALGPEHPRTIEQL